MNEIIALFLLLFSAYQDIKSGSISWLLIILFFFIALFIHPWQMIIMYGLVYLLALAFDKYGMDFCGGDMKVMAVLSGLVGIGAAIGSLALAMVIWRATRYPHRVAFIPFCLVGYLIYFFIITCLGRGTC